MVEPPPGDAPAVAVSVWLFTPWPLIDGALEITRPAPEIYGASSSGIPILAPEIQLLYKAKWHRPKDEHDFGQALPLLDATRRAWLKEALPRCYGEDRWIAQL